MHALLVISALLLVSARSEADETEEALEAAEAKIALFERRARIRSKARYAFDEMGAAAAALQVLAPRPVPENETAPTGASVEEIDAVAKRNGERRRRWERSNKAFEKRRDQLYKRWLKPMAKILILQLGRMRDGMDMGLTINLRAIELLAECRREDAATVLTKAIDQWLAKGEPWFAARFHPAAFQALPRFQSSDVLDWLVATFVGKERDQPPPIRVRTRMGGAITEELVTDVPVLALRAIAGHEGVSGEGRRRAVQRMVKAYAAAEERAAAGGAHAELWERIGAAASDATWALCGKPDEGFAAIPPTMLELATWFSAHRSPSEPAWQD